MENYIWAYIIGALVWAIIWGVATNNVIGNKGYSENWFWWGFFFGLIAFIVALTKPTAPKSQYSDIPDIPYKPTDTWKCGSCGRINKGFSCDCGMHRGDNELIPKRQIIEKTKEEMEAKAKKDDKDKQELDNLKKIKEYKELLDSNIISQEEFEIKKKQLLGL